MPPKNAREMHRKHDGPDGEHNSLLPTPIFGKATQHLIECVAIVTLWVE